MRSYWAYGLSICSEINFPELLQVNDQDAYDVHILSGDPFFIHPALDMEKPIAIVHEEQYAAIGVKHIALYEVIDGKQIVVHARPSAISSDIRVYCLSNAFALLLFQRNLLPLHAGGIMLNNEITLVMGKSGSGKSTLIYKMMQRGYRVFSDDVVVATTVIDGKVQVHSSYPMMKLWSDQMREMSLPLGVPIRSGVDKFPYYFHPLFDSHPRPVVNIILLKTSSSIQSCEWRRLSGSAQLIEVMSNIYRSEWMPDCMSKRSVSLLSQLVKQSSCFEIKRPLMQQSEDDMIGIFTSILGEKK